MNTSAILEQIKAEKKEREKLTSTLQRVKSAYNFGKVKTFYDVLFQLGLNEEMMLGPQYGYFKNELNTPVTKDFIWDYLNDIRLTYETAKWLKSNPPTPDENYLKQETEADISQGVQEGSTETPVTFEYPSSIDTFDGFEGYNFAPSPNEPKDLFLFFFQKKAAKQLLEGILEGKRGQLLLGGVGIGKTFILGAVIRRLLDAKFLDGKTISPFPIVYVTKASIVEQTQRALKKFFNITTDEVTVVNIEQLRARFGSMFLKEEIKFEGGVEHPIWKWRNNVYPCIIIWDECQILKNEDTTQSRIAQSYNEIVSAFTFQIFSSATPFVRVADAKCFSVSTRVPYTFGIAKNAPLTNAHWGDFAGHIASPAEPHEHNPPAIKRLREYLEKYIVQVTGVKFQFKAQNSVQMIDFETSKEKETYQNAWEAYLIDKAKLEGEEVKNSKWLTLVKFQKFRQAAELCRAHYLARKMYEAVTENNLAAIAVLNFKATITLVSRILIEQFNVPRDQISLIWGGSTKTKKQKDYEKKKKEIEKKLALKEKLQMSPEIMVMLEAEGLSVADMGLDDLDLDEIEEEPDFKKDIPDAYKLGPQSLKERQKEIDRFQAGKSLYCLYTFRAGGVGLSLHHTDEFTKEKVRHKASGYAFEEDIKTVPTRQRINFVAPTYSAIELVQGLGRAPRLTSLSNTVQYLLFYKGTIEEKVAYIVSVKLRCISKFVNQKEDWADVALKTHVDDKPEVAHTKPEDNEPDEDTGYVNADANGDDE